MHDVWLGVSAVGVQSLAAMTHRVSFIVVALPASRSFQELQTCTDCAVGSAYYWFIIVASAGVRRATLHSVLVEAGC
jgi:hypothetical protein